MGIICAQHRWSPRDVLAVLAMASCFGQAERDVGTVVDVVQVQSSTLFRYSCRRCSGTVVDVVQVQLSTLSTNHDEFLLRDLPR
ncbi:hypothetical protein KCV03_g206, partial [Aureobasidium melanogenum]